MTMPHERMRSIGWGSQLLGALQRDPSVPTELQEQAVRLEADYPGSQQLLQLLADPGRAFPAVASQAIEDARALFEKAQQLGVGGDVTRRELLFTLRHFPPRGWGVTAEEASRLGRLDEWLAPEPGW